MSSIEWIAYPLALLFLLFFSAFFSGSEIALFSLSPTKISGYRASKEPRRRLISFLLAKPRDLLVTIFILNTLVNIVLQNVASSLFSENSSLLLKVVPSLAITLLIGEIIPKYISLQMNERISYMVAPFIAFFTRILKPIREWTVAITTPISRVMFFFLKKENEISKQELDHLIRVSKEEGMLSSDEAELISGYINLQDSIIREIMRPREEILFYSLDEPIEELIRLFIDEECSRIPICKDTLDSVMGVLSAETFFIHQERISTVEDCFPILEKPFFVPESSSAKSLLKRFEQNESSFALVVDEYGTLSGLVTHEDLAEEIIGEIADRRDLHPLYTQTAEDIIIANAKMEVSHLEKLFNISLYNPSSRTTVGGWLTERAGDIPQSGAHFETDNLLIQVLASDPNRVKRLYIRKKKEEEK